jgi:hypothetical protein
MAEEEKETERGGSFCSSETDRYEDLLLPIPSRVLSIHSLHNEKTAGKSSAAVPSEETEQMRGGIEGGTRGERKTAQPQGPRSHTCSRRRKEP